MDSDRRVIVIVIVIVLESSAGKFCQSHKVRSHKSTDYAHVYLSKPNYQILGSIRAVKNENIFQKLNVH